MSAAESLHPGRAALVVVDLQERLLPAIHGADDVRRNAVLVLRAARRLALPVVATTQYARGLGPLVPDVQAELDGTPLDKTSFGCFGDPAFQSRLESLAGHPQLLVVGVETHICVMQTVLGGLARGRTMHVIADAVGARSEGNHRLGLSRMERAGAVLSSAEMAIYELLGRSDSAAFKDMLPLLKG